MRNRTDPITSQINGLDPPDVTPRRLLSPTAARSAVKRARAGLLAAVDDARGPSRVELDDPQHRRQALRLERPVHEPVRHLQRPTPFRMLPCRVVSVLVESVPERIPGQRLPSPIACQALCMGEEGVCEKALYFDIQTPGRHRGSKQSLGHAKRPSQCRANASLRQKMCHPRRARRIPG